MSPHMKNGKPLLPGQQAKQVQHLNRDACLEGHLESVLSRLATDTLQVFIVCMQNTLTEMGAAPRSSALNYALVLISVLGIYYVSQKD
jgi:hypothetical protein